MKGHVLGKSGRVLFYKVTLHSSCIVVNASGGRISKRECASNGWKIKRGWYEG